MFIQGNRQWEIRRVSFEQGPSICAPAPVYPVLPGNPDACLRRTPEPLLRGGSPLAPMFWHDETQMVSYPASSGGAGPCCTIGDAAEMRAGLMESAAPAPTPGMNRRSERSESVQDERWGGL